MMNAFKLTFSVFFVKREIRAAAAEEIKDCGARGGATKALRVLLNWLAVKTFI